MVTFLAIACYVLVIKEINSTKYNPIDIFHVMRNLKATFYNNQMTIKESDKKMKDIIKHLKIILPSNTYIN
jgi:hypothetical protein